jgi:hypothetical protein
MARLNFHWSWDPAINFRRIQIKEEQNGSSKTTERIGSQYS